MNAIWVKNLLEMNTELCFTLRIPRYKNVEINLIAKDVYNLFINGTFVSYGPARAAKGYARVDCIPIEKYLTEEENVLCVYVQSLYTHTLCFAKEKPLFGAEVYSDGKRLYSSEDFSCYRMTDKLVRTERMSCQRGFLEIYRMQAPRIPFDGSYFPLMETEIMESPVLLKRGVGYSLYEEETATKWETGGVWVDDTRTWRNDFTDLLDGVGKGKLGSYVRGECEEILSKQLVSFVFDGGNDSLPMRYEAYAMERVRCGKFKLKLKVEKSSSVYLIYDDYLVDGKVKFNREQIIHGLKWTLGAGEYELYSQEVYSAKYITLIVDGQIQIKSVSMIFVENPDVDLFSFACADETLQSIVYAAKHSYEQNAYDLFTDCPSRERGGYLCDGYFTAIAEHFFTGDNRVERNFLENYALYKNEHFSSDGILPMCYPSEPKNEEEYIPNWILWFVVQLGNRADRMQTEEIEPEFQEKLKNIVKYFENRENAYGLLQDLRGWVFLEWSRASDFMEDVNFPSNMLYCAALETAGRLLKDEVLLQKAKKLKNLIKELSFDGEFFVDNAVWENGKLQATKNISETCQYFAMFFNIASREEFPILYQKMFENFGAFRNADVYSQIHPSNMFIGYVVRLMLLARERKQDQLIAECKHTFADMAKSTSTIWELFAENASCNHGFGSITAKLICEALTGYIGIDEKEKSVCLTQDFIPINTCLQLPFRDVVIKITVCGNERKIESPDGYKIEIK